MKYARKFSVQNGFGKHRVPLPETPDECQDMEDSRELHTLLSSFTSAEECAIRQVAPMMSIVQLTCGNIGSRGNTSCVFINSKISILLPNLPTECKYVVVTREQVGGGGLKSTKYSRARIHRALELLKGTGHPAWKDIVIQQDRLSQWAEIGDLSQTNRELRFVVVDDDGQPVPPEDADFMDALPNNADEQDAGPAPLQFAGAENEESFVGIVNTSDEGKADAAQASLVEEQVRLLRERVFNQEQDGDDDRDAHGGDDGSPSGSEDEPDQPSTGQTNINGIPVGVQGDTATVQDRHVFPRSDGFVNMSSTPYAWSKAFPTVFIPTYASIGGVMGWYITHDVTAWHKPRDIRVKFNEWLEYMVWGDDGKFASHPTISLVAYNHKIRTQVNGQGRYVLNTSGIDPSITMDQLQNDEDKAAHRVAVEKMIHKATITSGNIPGTPAYQRATYQKFKAVEFYQNYIEGKDLNAFHTGSLAEYHDFNLRLLLCKYTQALTGADIAECERIMTDDSVFSQTVNKYRQVVTTYLASKMEIWFAHFLGPIFGLEAALLVYEFAKSRGVIHFHAPIAIAKETMNEVAEHLQIFAEVVNEEMEIVNEFCDETFTGPIMVKGKFMFSSPSDKFTVAGNQLRDDFCSMTPAGKAVWKNYLKKVEDANLGCAKQVAILMEGKLGVTAEHTGDAPSQVPIPGCPLEELGFRKTHPDMQSKEAIVGAGELKKPKWQRERLVQPEG
mmetsp:Transcript_3966/g.8936  ORF Transcript_3966/g.8936 Transcript_3966/m.8936 type:complete len:729 (+) Transcript_3966:1736-3922(+)